jgi:3-phosphoshikimate 1-carboxyvinyltransferase
VVVHIQPSGIKGRLFAPASKSSMQRAVAAALLKGGKSILKNAGHSNDDKAALNVITALGAKVEEMDNGSLNIISNGIAPITDKVNCGESGLGIRMFAPIISMSKDPMIIAGEGSLVLRPMDFFDEVLPQLGVQIHSNHGRLPLKIKGPILPRDITIDGSLSSQFLTGLLMVYAASDASDVSIKVNNLKSRPYIDLTLQVMKSFGLKLPVNNHYEEFYFPASDRANGSTEPPSPAVVEYEVEGDWSGTAFLLVAGAIAGSVEVLAIHNTSTQADKKIVDALLDAGAEVEVSADKVVVRKKKMEGFEFNATDCPDLFPPLVALAAHCKGLTKIRGLRRLKHKESDRGLTLREEFEKLSTQIDLHDDEMLVHGNGGVFVKNQILNSHHDHRIAMACAVACLQADFEVQIRNAEAVNKSYPDFWQHMKKLGALISEGSNVKP